MRRDERGEARRGEVRRRDASRCDAHRAGRNWERWTGASGRYPAAAFAASTAAAFTSVFVVAVFPCFPLVVSPLVPSALLLVFPPPSRAGLSGKNCKALPCRPSSLSSRLLPRSRSRVAFCVLSSLPGRLRVCVARWSGSRGASERTPVCLSRCRSKVSSSSPRESAISDAIEFSTVLNLSGGILPSRGVFSDTPPARSERERERVRDSREAHGIAEFRPTDSTLAEFRSPRRRGRSRELVPEKKRK